MNAERKFLHLILRWSLRLTAPVYSIYPQLPAWYSFLRRIVPYNLYVLLICLPPFCCRCWLAALGDLLSLVPYAGLSLAFLWRWLGRDLLLIPLAASRCQTIEKALRVTVMIFLF